MITISGKATDLENSMAQMMKNKISQMNIFEKLCHLEKVNDEIMQPEINWLEQKVLQKCSRELPVKISRVISQSLVPTIIEIIIKIEVLLTSRRTELINTGEVP